MIRADAIHLLLLLCLIVFLRFYSSMRSRGVSWRRTTIATFIYRATRVRPVYLRIRSIRCHRTPLAVITFRVNRTKSCGYRLSSITWLVRIRLQVSTPVPIATPSFSSGTAITRRTNKLRERYFSELLSSQYCCYFVCFFILYEVREATKYRNNKKIGWPILVCKHDSHTRLKKIIVNSMYWSVRIRKKLAN